MIEHNLNLNNLIINNNQQVIVNTQLEDRLNKLSKVSNDLTNSIKRDSFLINGLAVSLQNQVRLIKEKVINIRYATQWAKFNMINSIFLNEVELNEIKKIFNRNRMIRGTYQ